MAAMLNSPFWISHFLLRNRDLRPLRYEKLQIFTNKKIWIFHESQNFKLFKTRKIENFLRTKKIENFCELENFRIFHEPHICSFLLKKFKSQNKYSKFLMSQKISNFLKTKKLRIFTN